MRIAVILASTLWLSHAGAQSPTAGARLYEEHCAVCHGAHGHDGFAADIAVARIPRAPDDASLFKLIKNGFEGTDMPPAFGATDDEIHGIIVHVRGLGRAARERAPGNRARGEQVYRTKGNCGLCHMVTGQGGRQGPDLSEIGARRSAVKLREALLDPEAAVPPGYLLVNVKTKAGGSVTGIRLNEDSFSIQVRDLNDGIHSIWKSDIAEINKDWGKSTMPGYRTLLSPAEIDDLVAFLAALRGGL